ncbi:hypothetical protein [Nocardioides sp.]|uniref:hypothetical protein n=1 Tax=Nocardioides sp. TaxID=35761 RepID=UPI002ED9EF8D
MQKLIMTYLMLQAHLLEARDDEKGQGTLEYVGMIIVAAGIALAVLQAADAIDLGGVFTTAVNSVTGG